MADDSAAAAGAGAGAGATVSPVVIDDPTKALYVDEEDELVGEMDVIITQELSDELFMLQYPLAATYRPPDEPSAARMKPKHQMLELDYPLKSGPHLDETADGPTNVRQLTFESSAVPFKSHYCVGTIHDGALFLTPAKGLLQMRPKFDYLDAVDDDSDEETKTRNVAPAAAPKAGRTRVKTTIKPRESSRAMAARQNSYAYLKRSREAEAVTPMTVHGAESAEAKAFRAKMCGVSAGDVEVQGRRDYIEQFAPPEDAVGGTEPMTLHKLASMPIGLQVSEIMKRASVLPYPVVCDCVRRPASEEAMITALTEVAQLVAGCWVVKSDLVEEVDRFARVRDYVLLQIMNSADLSVARIDIVDATVTPGPDVLRILKAICTLNPETRRWTFKQSRDEAFLAAHSEVAASQASMWRNVAAALPYDVEGPTA